MHDIDDFLSQLHAIANRRDRADGPIVADRDPLVPPAEAGTVAFMITKRQRAQLRDRGFSDDAVAAMTPAEAHQHLRV